MYYPTNFGSVYPFENINIESAFISFTFNQNPLLLRTHPLIEYKYHRFMPFEAFKLN